VSWSEKIRCALQGIAVKALPNPEDARYDIADADAVLRDRPSRAVRSVGDALVKSDVVVTNMPGSYNQHLAAHAVCFLLASTGASTTPAAKARAAGRR
jgi:hypothetical protein